MLSIKSNYTETRIALMKFNEELQNSIKALQ